MARMRRRKVGRWSRGQSREESCLVCGKVIKAHAQTFHLQWTMHHRMHDRQRARGEDPTLTGEALMEQRRRRAARYFKEWHAANRDRVRRNNRRNAPKYKASKNASMRRWRKNNPESAAKSRAASYRRYAEQRRQANRRRAAAEPERRRARRAAFAAVQRGEVEKKPCAVCGETRRVYAHHEDYDKPLDVVWLCARHHAERHGITGSFRSEVGHGRD